MRPPQEEHNLKGIADNDILLMAKTDLQVMVYCDLDLGAYLLIVGDSAVSWKTQKQVPVSCSLLEVEYHSMTAMTSELIWLRLFLHL